MKNTVVTITNGISKEERIKDYTREKPSFEFSSRELIELKSNLDIFIDEYKDYCDEEYLFFLECLQAKLLGCIWRAREFESIRQRLFEYK